MTIYYKINKHMKLAVLSDIHGNFDALEAVLREARAGQADRLLVLGDSVGYYYQPGQVMQALAGWDTEMIRGNHEEILCRLIDDPSMEPAITRKYGSGHRCALDQLDAAQISLLRSLPETKRISIGPVSLLLCHGSPWDAGQYIYPDAAEEVLKRFDDYPSHFILFGHTHYACCFKTRSGLAVNPGSVGQSREKGGQASWALIDTANRTVRFRNTPYDSAALEAQAAKLDPDYSYGRMILTRNS